MILENSKGKVLELLRSKLSRFKVADIYIFTSDEFESEPGTILEKIASKFLGKSVVLRSSASDEDGGNGSFAGEFDSILDVPVDDVSALRCSIEAVISSYRKNGRPPRNEDVIVQEMIGDVSMSGVVFTHELNTGAPYYVFNYDDISGLTNTVTSGGGEHANRTLYIHRGQFAPLRSDRFLTLLKAVKEVEELLGSQFLDMEFALTKDLTPYLFQVRPITTQSNWGPAVSHRIDAQLVGIQSFIKERLLPKVGAYGKTTVLGQMPDWNPVEMLGRTPRALALSLYKTLITNDAWRKARSIMGYAVPAGHPLLISLAGQPFIDTRLSFHSYLPATLPPDIAEKLVDKWVADLREQPALHDKIEFEIAITTFSFDMEEKISVQIGAVLNEAEKHAFKQAHFDQTMSLLDENHQGSVANALKKVDKLAVMQASNDQLSDSCAISALYGMIDDCIELGTVPFSILARHGFMAKTILLSLEKRGVISSKEVLAILSGIRTVAGDLVEDMQRLQCGEITRKTFLDKYGHLRPGTYDILSLRYDQMTDFDLAETRERIVQKDWGKTLPDRKMKDIDSFLESEGFSGINAASLLDYVYAATAGREYGKFIFTRSVSDIIELIANFGNLHGLSRDDMSHVSLQQLLEIMSQSGEPNLRDHLRTMAVSGAGEHAMSIAIRLPEVLFDEAGVCVVPFQVSRPNFITTKKITAPVEILRARGAVPSLAGKIVLIENADPGFDWIFSQSIAGLITMFGGANSHMAIRCAEFGIPAAIGCGQQRFKRYLCVSRVSLDCASGIINPLH